MTTQELLELVTKETIIEIMSECDATCHGQGVTSDGAIYLKFPTVCHQGNSIDKLWWYDNTKQFMCWTCCGNMSLFNFLMKVQHWTFKESFIYVARKVGVSLSSQDRYGIQDPASVKATHAEITEMEKQIEARANKYTVQNITKFYDPKVLKRFDSKTFYQGWINEGISEETMQKFNISFYWLEGHIIIPHYDIQGQLVGVRRRSLNPEDAKNKYMPEYIDNQFYDHPLGLNLYGLYQNKAAIQKRKAAILVEGEKSVMLSDTYYHEKSITVATCGFNISDWQMQALRKLGVNTVYLGFDKDYDVTLEDKYHSDSITWENYCHYKDRLLTLGRRLAMFFDTYIIFDKNKMLQIKDAPVDRGKEIFERLVQSAKLIKTD